MILQIELVKASHYFDSIISEVSTLTEDDMKYRKIIDDLVDVCKNGKAKWGLKE